MRSHWRDNKNFLLVNFIMMIVIQKPESIGSWIVLKYQDK